MQWLLRVVIVILLSAGFVIDAASSRYFSEIKSFGFPNLAVSSPTDLCFGSDGRFYGTSREGIFTVAANGLDFKTLHRGTSVFSTGAGLIEGRNGRLYGVSFRRLPSGENVNELYSLAKDGSDFRATLIPGSATSSLEQLHHSSDGELYLIAPSGPALTLFRVENDGTGFAPLYSFDMESNLGRPVGKLLELPGGIFVGAGSGQTSGGTRGGGIYRIKRDGTDFRILREFHFADPITTDPNRPLAGVILAGGRLYGTARAENAASAVYSINLDGGDLRVEKHLAAEAIGGLILSPAGRILGATSYPRPFMFEMDLDGGNYRETPLNDPDTSVGMLTSSMVVIGDGVFGLAEDEWSSSRDGFLFLFQPLMEPRARILRRLQQSGGDGFMPVALLSSSDGTMFGASVTGGEAAAGAVWKISGDGTGYQILRHFSAFRDGGSPVILAEAPEGKLFGILLATTPSFPDETRYNFGAVFRMSQTPGPFETLRSHRNEYPTSILYAKNNRVYVTVSPTLPDASGAISYIYSMSSDGSDQVVFKTFPASQTPDLGQLLEGSDGNFYVTGGASLFRISPTGEADRVFDHDWRAPHTLVEGSDGSLYGSSSAWGFFRINKDGIGYRSVPLWGGRDLYGTRVLEDRPGHFLVVDRSNLYSVTASTMAVEQLRGFWQNAAFGLVKGAGDRVIGITRSGGDMGIGTVYRFGEAISAPQLAIGSGSPGNIVVSIFGSVGTQFQIQAAPTLTGPWESIRRDFLHPTGLPFPRPATDREFFRARLLEY